MLIIFTVFDWGKAYFLFEDFGKMHLVGIAHFAPDFTNGTIGGNQKKLCLRQTLVYDIFLRGKPKHFLELRGEIFGGNNRKGWQGK